MSSASVPPSRPQVTTKEAESMLSDTKHYGAWDPFETHNYTESATKSMWPVIILLHCGLCNVAYNRNNISLMLTTIAIFPDSKGPSCDSVPHHLLDTWRSLLQPEECHWCDWGDDQGPDKIRQQTHCCSLQWHSDSQWNVLCHSHHHWEMQDRGSGGCVPGG